MRSCLLFLPLAAVASAATAQPAPQAAETIAIPPALTDPATTEKLGGMMQALSKAFLNLPIGEVQAAAEGRAPTAAEKRMTVRDLGRRDDPNFERNLERGLAESRPAVQAAMKAMTAALPAMMKGMSEAARELEKATANMPSPNYPKR